MRYATVFFTPQSSSSGGIVFFFKRLKYSYKRLILSFKSFHSTLLIPPMFEQVFRNIDDILYKDSGADSELDYIGQTSWVMFLRYLENLEQEKADDAVLQGKK